MPDLLIDQSNCTSCGQCRSICPLRVIVLPEFDVPSYTSGGAERCILCGHCEAICPTGALQVCDPRLEARSHPKVESRLLPQLLADHLRMRRSVRHFRAEPVARTVVEEILDIVRYAPTGANSQCVDWLIIHDTVEVRRLTGLVVDWMRHAAAHPSPLHDYFNFPAMIASWEKGHDPIGRKAPHLAIAHTGQGVTARTDAYIALAHFDIVAPIFGVGTCWAGFFQFAMEHWPPLQQALNLPAGHQPCYTLLFGTPAVRFRRPPKRKVPTVIWR